jgi:hypothetical protein
MAEIKGFNLMADNSNQLTWMEDPADIIVLTNQTKQNFILDLPSGRFRLDAGRRMRTLRSILTVAQVQQLVDAGQLKVEAK